MGWDPCARPEALWALRCGQANIQQKVMLGGFRNGMGGGAGLDYLYYGTILSKKTILAILEM